MIESGRPSDTLDDKSAVHWFAIFSISSSLLFSLTQDTFTDPMADCELQALKGHGQTTCIDDPSSMLR